MRVDLRLQGAHLGPRGELGLALELIHGELRGQQLGKARGEGVLRAVHMAGGAVIELEGAHRLAADLERGDDARRDVALAPLFAAHVHHARERLRDAVLDDVARGGRMDGRARGKVVGELAHAGEHHVAVGHGDGHGAGLGQQAAADLLGALAREAAGDVLEHAGGHGERLLRILRAQGVGAKEHVNKTAGEQHQQHQGRNGGEGLDAREDGVAKKAHHGKDDERRQQAQSLIRVEHARAVRALGDVLRPLGTFGRFWRYGFGHQRSNRAARRSSPESPPMILGQKLTNLR